jgi:Holliday junction DNA helicase RuvA
MLYSVTGKVILKSDRFAVIETGGADGGLGLKLFMSARTIAALPTAGAPTAVKVFAHLHMREDALELYGFGSEKELMYFEMLISVSGVGPKSALSILDITNMDELAASIKEGRAELLSRASGIGHKTAERIILELRSKVQSAKSGAVVEKMEGDADLVEALSNLGYRREEARAALGKIDLKITGIEARLKEALKILGKRG